MKNDTSAIAQRSNKRRVKLFTKFKQKLNTLVKNHSKLLLIIQL
ncbi:hypothetical protein SAMN04488028_10236 [Reichenbachiella agariperforans]|uniref:Uncharacterized protein n=1 Tax=Reichenbachiella agariperforans TaxID=156994 RepID=A0A1M6N084_REIAG|nr:hypothetical protein SAMN04488028_10236 [Reichenbachiella agariperforans]